MTWEPELLKREMAAVVSHMRIVYWESAVQNALQSAVVPSTRTKSSDCVPASLAQRTPVSRPVRRARCHRP